MDQPLDDYWIWLSDKVRACVSLYCFMDIGGKLWKRLHEFVQNSTDIESYGSNYKTYKLILALW